MAHINSTSYRIPASCSSARPRAMLSMRAKKLAFNGLVLRTYGLGFGGSGFRVCG